MDLVISKNCYNFIALIYKDLQTIIAMITESKVIELFCMADDFCKFFEAMMTKYTLKPATKRKYHRAFHPVKGRNHAHYDTFS